MQFEKRAVQHSSDIIHKGRFSSFSHILYLYATEAAQKVHIITYVYVAAVTSFVSLFNCIACPSLIKKWAKLTYTWKECYARNVSTVVNVIMTVQYVCIGQYKIRWVCMVVHEYSFHPLYVMYILAPKPHIHAITGQHIKCTDKDWQALHACIFNAPFCVFMHDGGNNEGFLYAWSF